MDEEKSTIPKQGSRNVENEQETEDQSNETEDAELDERVTAVANQTQSIVWSFMQEYNEVQMRSALSPGQPFRHMSTQTDELREVENAVNAVPPATRKIVVEEFIRTPPPDQATRQVAHSLRRIAEDMEQTYRPTVMTLVNRWLMGLHRDSGGNLTLETVWTAFRRVADAVLYSGVTWGKVLLLLLFAYEIAVALYVEGVPEFVRSLISSFVQFLIKSPVIKWIAEHGGWAAAVTALWMQSMRRHIATLAPFIAWAVGVGALALGAFLFTKRK